MSTTAGQRHRSVVQLSAPHILSSSTLLYQAWQFSCATCMNHRCSCPDVANTWLRMFSCCTCREHGRKSGRGAANTTCTKTVLHISGACTFSVFITLLYLKTMKSPISKTSCRIRKKLISDDTQHSSHPHSDTLIRNDDCTRNVETAVIFQQTTYPVV